jgi:oxygen-independent coproporphyrinogen-3 oxidase
LPARIKHQRQIPNETLPDSMARFEQSNRLAEMLMKEGFARIGLDHFAWQDDTLATKQINRNFQGYTTDAADTLLGFGASAIGRLPQGFVQNAVLAPDYAQRVKTDGLATARGIELSAEDRIRSFVIERLMCDLEFPSAELARRFGAAAKPVLDEAEQIIASNPDQLIERTAGGFRVTDRGRPFVRTIASKFDSYLAASKATHSAGV